jgi:hypothetical protein
MRPRNRGNRGGLEDADVGRGDWHQRGHVDGQQDRGRRGDAGLALEVEGVQDRVGGECLDRPRGELDDDRPSP